MSIWMLLIVGVLTLVISSMFRNARNQPPPFPRPREILDAELEDDEVPTVAAVPPPLPPRRRGPPTALPRAGRVQTIESLPVAQAAQPRHTASSILDMPVPILTETKARSPMSGKLAAMLKDRSSLRTVMQLREVLAPPLCKRRK